MSNLVYIAPACDKPDVFEAPASVAISPRQVMVLTAGQFALAGANQSGVLYFAGNDILEEVTDAYAVGATVQGFRPKSGEYYELQLAAAQTIAKGAALTTDASGNLVALGAGTNVVAYADEAVTTTGSVGSIRVYIK